MSWLPDDTVDRLKQVVELPDTRGTRYDIVDFVARGGMGAVYRARDFEEAKDKIRQILNVKGIGHSCGIHTADMEHARELAEEIDVVRVIVNQAHTFANGGSFDNGMNFTLSMGCGTWGGNSISENLNYRNFINITHLVTEIPEDKPSEEELFGAHWAKYGK